MKSKWHKCAFGEIVSFSSGGTPNKSIDEYWNGDIPWISAKTMKNERVSSSDLYITKEGLQHGRKLAKKGSILFLVRGSGLFNGIPVCLVEKPVAYNQDVKCIESCCEVENIYIFYWLLSQVKTLKGLVGTTTIGAGKFDMDQIKQLEFCYQASFHCTLWIETYISKILSGRPLIEFSDSAREYKTESELRERIDELHTEIGRIREPVFPEDVDMYVSLTRWAKDRAAYDRLMDLESELADCEDELDKRLPAKFDHKNTILYIYKWGNIICKKQDHELVDVNCVITSVNDEITVNAQYCRDCNKFIISESSYRFYLDGFSFIPAKFRYVDEDGNFPQRLYKKERGSYSPLSLAGYTVRADKALSKKERHKLLAFLIDNGVMDKYEIIGYLEMFINTNGQKTGMERAVAKWENDAKYVRQYNMDKQDTYQIDSVEPY